MNSAEQSLWDWLYKAFRKLHDIDWQRVENAVGSGTPDVEVCFRSVSFWIELKIAEPYKTKDAFKVKFRPLQVPWLTRRTNRGGRAFVLIREGRDTYLIPGEHAHLVDGPVDRQAAQALSICPLRPKPLQVLEACIKHPTALRSPSQ